MAGAGDIGSLAGGHNVCMAGVLMACGLHMQMGGSSCTVSAGGDTASGASDLQGCGLGSGSCSVSLPKRRAQRLWIAAILSGCASWTPLMALARQCVASYAIGGCYGRDRDCMMFIVERVRDAFTPRIFHDDTNAMVVGGGLGEVPCFGGMMTLHFGLAGFLMN
jgi:hypothetical protein